MRAGAPWRLLPGDLRGTDGMALVVPNLTMGDGEVHDVLYLASMSNDVRAFDANTPNPETGQGQVLWERRVGNPIKGTRQMDMYLVGDFWGVLSTPVIDMVTGTLYVVSMCSPDGLIADCEFFLHALSLYDGSDLAAPLSLNAATYEPPGGAIASVMGSVPRKQRCGLLLDRRDGVATVFVANGSFNEDSDSNQGWLIACDVSTLGEMSIAAAWTTTVPPHSGGGIWMGAQGPSMSDDGSIFLAVGNGDFDGVHNFGECLMKLRHTAKAGSTPASLQPVGWAPPFTDPGRVGEDPTLPAVTGDNDDTPGGTSNMDSPGDEDLNAGGMGLLPASLTGFSRAYVGVAGKDGAYQCVDASVFPQIDLAWFAPGLRFKVWACFALPPTYVTFFPGAMTATPDDSFTEMLTTAGGRTHHMHATPVVYKSPRYPDGVLLYFGGENGPVKVYLLTEPTPGKLAIQWLADGAEIASAEVPNPGGMPGTMITLSANGAVEDTAVLWCLQPYGDANKTISAGRLIAYGADWIAPGGRLVKIWDSQTWGVPITHNKFDIPACINGKLYVPSYDGRMMVFELAAAA